MRFIVIAAGIVAVLFAGTAIVMRLVPMPAEIWHLDPADVAPPDTPNFVLLRGDEAVTRPGTVADISARIDEIARGDGARLIGGTVAEGHMTYVHRTALMGFPDAISIRVRPAEETGQTAIEVFSRSRFGHSDMGVNDRRVTRWLEQLAP
ncbi:DUF1499 domain-containing protein [Rhodophyticola porphyridii]|uniref:DUF1499 domain-containing protein n=1 Tax=Rhodophyticola porphyridii TaxID=1852017 RepID=A0A3L9Y2R4_9RHOB|nr:DUF1499 domain-containing protein [Rhodophyticola porphyridii]RMA41725.1 DUF1499 domain-containing protein [Rhodophyticola porphyridii]